MKIPAKLPQFLVEKSLLIVTSRQNAIFYYAYAGSIEKLSEVKVPKPHYFDREGFFVGRNSNLTYRSGSVYELSDKLVKHDFFQVFKDSLLPLLKNTEFTDIYVFSPNHMITEIKKILPHRSSVAMSIRGNYVAFHPLELIKRIDDKLSKKLGRIRKKPITEEERKILDKAKRACSKYKCNTKKFTF